MTITLRDRPDGQIEVLVQKPVVVCVLADRDLAERFVAFLTLEDDAAEEDSVRIAKGGVDEAAQELDLSQIAQEVAPVPSKPRSRRKQRAQLPAVIDKPKAPALLPVVRPALTDAQLDEAFGLLGGGREALCCSHPLRGADVAAAGLLGAAPQAGAAAPRGRWAAALFPVPEAIHALDFQPGNLRAVQP
jgi:hypothetical protein